MFITVRLHEKKQVVILSTLMSKEDPVFNGMSPMPVILVFIYSVDIMYILLIGRAQCMKWFLIFSGGKETQ